MKNRNNKSLLTKRPSICFVGLDCYDLFAKQGNLLTFGGAEIQQYLIARWLVSRGYSVSFITFDRGQLDAMFFDGIQFFKAYNPRAGFPLFRFLHPRWTGLCSALTRANADIYYQRSAEEYTGQVALWCKKNKRRFVFASASEADCILALPFLNTRRERVLYRIGVRYADVVVAQTEKQKTLLQKHFGVSSTVIKSSATPLDLQLPSPTCIGTLKNTSVLWVGKLLPEKRFNWILDIAEKCCSLRFDIVGLSSEVDYASTLIQRASKISNVFMHGKIPHSKMIEFYRRCKVLCSTSSLEGFPNTFLEAWSLGIPVVSTYDPDGVIARNGLGIVTSSIGSTSSGLNKIINSVEMYGMVSTAAKKYFQDNHTLETNMPVLERIFFEEP